MKGTNNITQNFFFTEANGNLCYNAKCHINWKYAYVESFQGGKKKEKKRKYCWSQGSISDKCQMASYRETIRTII